MYDAVVADTPDRTATSMSVTLRVLATATFLPIRARRGRDPVPRRLRWPLPHRCLTLTQPRAMILLIRFSI
jgi:hypothetical protein